MTDFNLPATLTVAARAGSQPAHLETAGMDGKAGSRACKQVEVRNLR